MLEKILNGYGRDMVLRRDGKETPVRGFFQPDTGRTDRLADNQRGILGREDRMRFSYYGPAEYLLKNGDEVNVDGMAYLVRNGRVMEAAGVPVYCWALCVEKGGEDPWGLSG